MTIVQLIGIDPGLVDTGVVRIRIDTATRSVTVKENVFTNVSAGAIGVFVDQARDAHTYQFSTYVYIEDFRVRKGYSTNIPMIGFINDLRKTVPSAKVLNNMGVTKVITKPIMEAFGVWDFNISTHHQDLRSAARIALFGAVRDDGLNNKFIFPVLLAAAAGQVPFTTINV